MNQKWRDEQFAKISSGDAVFSYIPDEIGSIVYCDSTTDQPNAKWKAVCNLLIGATIAITVLSLCFWWNSMPGEMWFLNFLFTLLVVSCSVWIIYLMQCSSKDSDYFIGEDGFAAVRFRGSRDNIISKQVVLFDNMEGIYFKESHNFVQPRNSVLRQGYFVTSGSFAAFEKSHNGLPPKKVFALRGSSVDEYAVDTPVSNRDPVEYSFIWIISDMWHKLFRDRCMGNEAVEFPIVGHRKKMQDKKIIVYPWGIQVLGKRIKTDEIQAFEITDGGSLRIEYANHENPVFWKRNTQSIKIRYSYIVNGEIMVRMVNEMIFA